MGSRYNPAEEREPALASGRGPGMSGTPGRTNV